MPGGIAGVLNSFIVPNVMKTTPETMRRTLSIRLGHGAGAGSNIDIADSNLGFAAAYADAANHVSIQYGGGAGCKAPQTGGDADLLPLATRRLDQTRNQLAAERRDVGDDAPPHQVPFAERGLVHPPRPGVDQIVLDSE